MAKDYTQLLERVPTAELLKAAKERNSKLREQFGRYAAQKKIVQCPKCSFQGGVREMRTHKCA